MTRLSPFPLNGKRAHSTLYFLSFTGLTHPVIGTLTCRGYCKTTSRAGDRCRASRSIKARAAVERILQAALDEGCVGMELWEAVSAELEGLCCRFHRCVEVVEEMVFLVEEYRVQVLGRVPEGEGWTYAAEVELEKTLEFDEESLLMEELMEAEMIAEMEDYLVLETSMRCCPASATDDNVSNKTITTAYDKMCSITPTIKETISDTFFDAENTASTPIGEGLSIPRKQEHSSCS